MRIKIGVMGSADDALRKKIVDIAKEEYEKWRLAPAPEKQAVREAELPSNEVLTQESRAELELCRESNWISNESTSTFLNNFQITFPREEKFSIFRILRFCTFGNIPASFSNQVS